MNCLIIDDNATIANIISATLTAYGYICENKRLSFTELADYELLRAELKKAERDLIIVNITSCKKPTEIQKLVNIIKENCKKTIVFGITYNSHDQNKISFLKSGGDDIIVYPFKMQEFLARIQTQLRHKTTEKSSVIQVNQLKVDTNQQKVFEDKREIPLRRKEYTIIEYMARNMNRAISRAELMDHVWDYKRILGSNTVDVHINRIRRKLSHPLTLTTVYGYGYKLMDGKRRGKE